MIRTRPSNQRKGLPAKKALQHSQGLNFCSTKLTTTRGRRGVAFVPRPPVRAVPSRHPLAPGASPQCLRNTLSQCNMRATRASPYAAGECAVHRLHELGDPLVEPLAIRIRKMSQQIYARSEAIMPAMSVSISVARWSLHALTRGRTSSRRS